MYFIVETAEQLKKLEVEEDCFVHVIQSNDKMHPRLSRVSLVYYHTQSKGYIFPINHSEGFALNMQEINLFLSKHSKLYVIDAKRHSYYIQHPNIVDVAFIKLDKDNSNDIQNCDTLAHRTLQNRLRDELHLNEIIPITKHYESCECYYESIKHFIGLEQDVTLYSRLSRAYKSVEQAGIAINAQLFNRLYPNIDLNMLCENNIIYNSYNLYNVTGRPTNSFSGLNFLAIPKEGSYRDCFIPSNDLLIEFDFDSYHLRLIANVIGYTFPDPKESIHNYLARQYFNKQDISDTEYSESKSISFKQLYGGIESKYKKIPFLATIGSFIDSEWNKYKRDGCYILPTGRVLRYDKSLNKLKLFNYIIQNIETKHNLFMIEEILDFISKNDYKSKLILITYDSFLFDYSLQDKKECLIGIKNILQQDNMLVKYKYGKSYNFSI